VAPATALKVLHDLQHAATLEAREQAGAGDASSGGTGLTVELTVELQLTADTAAEVLHHYWRFMPMRTQERKAQAQRLKEVLERLYEQMEAAKGLLSAGERHAASRLLRPVEQALHKAFSSFDDAVAQTQ